MAYIGDKGKVDKSDIDEIVTRNIDDKIYNLIDLYNSNKKEEALKFYGDLLSEGEKVGGIFATFSYNYSNLIVCKDLMQRGKGQREIADTMGMEPWRVLKLMNANKYVNIDTLMEKMKKITDIALARVKGNLDEDYMVLLLMN
jgi:DNA polymerase-3 subunit delta